MTDIEEKVMDRCPFCGFRKSLYQPSPTFIEYECGTSLWGKDDWSRSDDCFTKQVEDQETQITALRSLLRELGKATTQLLSGHDQLYDAFFHYLPDRNPLNDLAAQDAREILNRPDFKAIMEVNDG